MPRMTNEEALDILERQIECSNGNCPEPWMSCRECPYNVDAIDYAGACKMAIEALSKQCASSEQVDKAWDMLSEVYDMPDVPGKAKDIIGDVMLMLHQMIVRADESIITDFVAFQREWLKTHKIMELNSADEVMTEIFLKETGKAFIDSLGQSGENDEADQFRDSAKKTEDVPVIHVGKTDFQPGDKFILELGTERRMFKEFEIAGTDLYVKTDLLEKLTRYESEA